MIELLMAFFSGSGEDDVEKRPLAGIVQAAMLLFAVGLVVWAIVAV